MKILLISYYWPPASSVGVRRWLRFVQELDKSRYDITVVCPADASYPSTDSSLARDIEGVTLLPVPIWEWRDLYDKLTRSHKDTDKEGSIDRIFYREKSQKSLLQRLSLWLRANVVIPDARASWIRPCIQAIIAYLEEHDADVIISTGPPHSCHLIAEHIKRAHADIPWIADFRDPWSGGANFGVLPLTSWGKRRHMRLERSVLRHADCILTVSWTWQQQLADLGAKRTALITNGFDPADFTDEPSNTASDKFIISHVGTLFSDRSATVFWETLREILTERPTLRETLRVRLIGRISEEIHSIIESYGLTDIVELVGTISPRSAISEMQSADLLLLVVNKSIDYQGRIPAKIYEYIAAAKPILVIGPDDADIHRVAPYAVSLDESISIKERITRLSQLIDAPHAITTNELLHQSPYSIAKITSQLEELLQSVVSLSQD